MTELGMGGVDFKERQHDGNISSLDKLFTCWFTLKKLKISDVGDMKQPAMPQV